MKWKDYITRRRLNVQSWLVSKGVDSVESFVALIQKIGVEQPTEDEINAIFPKPQPTIIKIEEVEQSAINLNQTKKRSKNG